MGFGAARNSRGPASPRVANSPIRNSARERLGDRFAARSGLQACVGGMARTDSLAQLVLRGNCDRLHHVSLRLENRAEHCDGFWTGRLEEPGCCRDRQGSTPRWKVMEVQTTRNAWRALDRAIVCQSSEK